mmetsp:Transcript_7356/g.15780  ORF Transcript_7356/g.15780 Transcript_7356/m.15780 type:complete len:608 (+) Transcript_7356:286-2109(+)
MSFNGSIRPPHPEQPQYQRSHDYHVDHGAPSANNPKSLHSPQSYPFEQDRHPTHIKSFEDRVNQALQRKSSTPIHPHIQELQARQNQATDIPSVIHGLHMDHYVNETNDIVYDGESEKDNNDGWGGEFVEVLPNDKGCMVSTADDLGYLFGCGTSPQDEVVVIYNSKNNPNKQEKWIHDMLLRNEDPATSPRGRQQQLDESRESTEKSTRQVRDYEFLRELPDDSDRDYQTKNSCNPFINLSHILFSSGKCPQPSSLEHPRERTSRGQHYPSEKENQIRYEMNRRQHEAFRANATCHHQRYVDTELAEVKNQLNAIMREQHQKHATPPPVPPLPSAALHDDKISTEIDRLRQEQYALTQAMQQLQQQQLQMTIQAAAMAQQQMQSSMMTSPRSMNMMTSPLNTNMMHSPTSHQYQVQNQNFSLEPMSPLARSHQSHQQAFNSSNPMHDFASPPVSPTKHGMMSYFTCNGVVNNTKQDNKEDTFGLFHYASDNPKETKVKSNDWFSSTIKYKEEDFSAREQPSSTRRHEDGGSKHASSKLLDDLKMKNATMRLEIERLKKDMDEQRIKSDGTWMSVGTDGSGDMNAESRMGVGYRSYVAKRQSHLGFS